MSRVFFKFFTAIHLFIYQLSGGKVSGVVRGLHVLLLTTTGRKTGKLHTTPLGYFNHDGGYVIAGTNSGSDRHPNWYYNLKNNPMAKIQIKNTHIQVKAELIQGPERDQLWNDLIHRSPGYADYQKRTMREIPLVILHPSGG